MEAKEPMPAYGMYASADVLKGKIVSRVEHEDDTHVLQLLYSYIQHVQSKPRVNCKPKYSLSALAGILKGGNFDDASYDEMRDQYLKERYAI